MRMKNLELGYTFPKSLVGKIGDFGHPRLRQRPEPLYAHPLQGFRPRACGCQCHEHLRLPAGPDLHRRPERNLLSHEKVFHPHHRSPAACGMVERLCRLPEHRSRRQVVAQHLPQGRRAGQEHAGGHLLLFLRRFAGLYHPLHLREHVRQLLQPPHLGVQRRIRPRHADRRELVGRIEMDQGLAGPSRAPTP